MDPVLAAKKLEYEEKKARAKALKLRLTCTICGARPKILLNCPCGTTQYCSTACQRIDWRDRGHRKACKKIRDERAAEAARAEAPTPPEAVFYGPAPRSQADEIRARIAAEHEAARLRREANPEPESARYGSRCPICLEKWDVNVGPTLLSCCCGKVCVSCTEKMGDTCPLCRATKPDSFEEMITLLRRHVENEVPEAIGKLAWHYARGDMYGVVNFKKANKLYKRAAELGDVVSMTTLGAFLCAGHGCKVDFVKGAQLFRTAAGRGSAEGQFYFGKALMQGDGVPEDVEQARVMFERSAAQGFEPAMEILAGSTSVAQYFAALETVRKHERRDRLRKQRAAVIEIAAFCQRHARRLAAVCVVRRRRAAARAARLSV